MPAIIEPVPYRQVHRVTMLLRTVEWEEWEEQEEEEQEQEEEEGGNNMLSKTQREEEK